MSSETSSTLSDASADYQQSCSNFRVALYNRNLASRKASNAMRFKNSAIQMVKTATPTSGMPPSEAIRNAIQLTTEYAEAISALDVTIADLQVAETEMHQAYHKLETVYAEFGSETESKVATATESTTVTESKTDYMSYDLVSVGERLQTACDVAYRKLRTTPAHDLAQIKANQIAYDKSITAYAYLLAGGGVVNC